MTEEQKIDTTQDVIRKTRVTVVENIYCQLPDEDATQYPSSPGFVRWLESEEEPYSRRFRITSEWKPLDFGWLKDGVSLFILENLGPLPQQHNPAPEDKIDPRDLSIRLKPGGTEFFWLVPVGESARFSPGFLLDECNVLVSCSRSQVRCVLHALPR